MALLRKKVTPRMAAANRANGAKSTGPRTAAGKIQSSRNSRRYGIHSKTLFSRLRGLGEDPRDFEKQHRAIYVALKPNDTFEEMLVEDMVALRWRRLRILRAETEAWDRFRWASVRNAANGGGLENDADPEMDRYLSEQDVIRIARELPSWIKEEPEIYGNLSCPAQGIGGFGLVIFSLQVFRMDFKGFDDDGLQWLETLYGPTPSVGGRLLLDKYKEYLGQERADPAVRARNHDSFLQDVDSELMFYNRMRSLVGHSQTSTDGTSWVGLGEDLEKLARYEAHLERQFERKLQQFVAWRRAKGELAVPGRPDSKGH
jgi:hypothetical protein